MTPTERATYNAGIKAAINAPQIVAISIETHQHARNLAEIREALVKRGIIRNV